MLYPHSHFSLLVFDPTVYLVLPFFLQQFFSIPVHSSLHQSRTRCCSLCLFYLSSHFSLIASLPFYSDHSPSFQHPSSLWISSCLLFLLLSFPPCLSIFSIPPYSKAMDQGGDRLIAVWCAFAGLYATHLSSVRHVINYPCFYWYMANTSKKSNTSH